MALTLTGNDSFLAPALIAGAMLLVYPGSRLLSSLGRGNALARAIGHAVPLLVVLALLARAGRSAAIVSLLFAVSVASLTLVLGTTLINRRDGAGVDRFERIWGMVLPIGLLCFLIGFRAEITWVHAIMLTIQGGLILLIARKGTIEGSLQFPRHSPMMLAIIACVGIATSIGGGLVAMRGVDQLTSTLPNLTGSVAAALILAPMLVLPMVGAGVGLAHERATDLAISTSTNFVILNLCVLLPVMVIFWMSQHQVAMPFPIAVWRVDSVLICILGALLFPASMKRWALGRLEGVILVIAYLGYMIVTAIYATR